MPAPFKRCAERILMFFIRSAEKKDYSAVFQLARVLNSYNLAAEGKFIRKLLRDSELSFRGKVKRPEKRRFLFVCEDARSKKVIGCSLIIARHGTPRLPHLSFLMVRETRESRTLKRQVKHTVLKLHSDKQGYSELGGLVTLPRYRRRPEKLGKQLSFVRLAYLRWHPGLFRRKLLVEYLPKLDPVKGNKIWNALGKKVTGLSYQQADRLSVGNKEFILSLFPKEKIYGSLLPSDAMKDLGSPGKGAKASVRMLKRIGFKFLNQIDPFDGGPHYGATLSKVPLIKRTRFYSYIPFPPHLTSPSRGEGTRNKLLKEALILTEKKGKIRACIGRFQKQRRKIALDRETVSILKLSRGDRYSITPFGG